jgi:hypothetical protein
MVTVNDSYQLNIAMQVMKGSFFPLKIPLVFGFNWFGQQDLSELSINHLKKNIFNFN